MSNFLSDGDYEHAGDILEWIMEDKKDVDEDKFDLLAFAAGMRWTGTKSREVCEVPAHCVEQAHRWDAASTGQKRTTQRRSERI